MISFQLTNGVNSWLKRTFATLVKLLWCSCSRTSYLILLFACCSLLLAVVGIFKLFISAVCSLLFIFSADMYNATGLRSYFTLWCRSHISYCNIQSLWLQSDRRQWPAVIYSILIYVTHYCTVYPLFMYQCLYIPAFGKAVVIKPSVSHESLCYTASQ